MTGRSAYLNGEFVAEADARISVFDSALNFGDMVFESVRTFGHIPFRLDHHLQRLGVSLRLLDIDCGLSLEDIERCMLQTLERNRPTEADDVDWQIVINVSRGLLPTYRAASPQALRPTVCIHCWPLIPHLGRFAANYDSGVDLICSSQPSIPAHIIDPRAKTRSRVHYRLAQLQAARVGDNLWPILRNDEGCLTEGPSWNFFLFKAGVLSTPEIGSVLGGVSRATTIELADELGIEVRETEITSEAARAADEIFCTATSFCLVHAHSFEGQVIGDGQAGPAVAQLRLAWQRRVGLDFVGQARGYAERLDDWEERELARLSNPPNR